MIIKGFAQICLVRGVYNTKNWWLTVVLDNFPLVLWKLSDIFCHMMISQTAQLWVNPILSGEREWRQLSLCLPARYE